MSNAGLEVWGELQAAAKKLGLYPKLSWHNGATKAIHGQFALNGTSRIVGEVVISKEGIIMPSGAIKALLSY